MLLQKTCMLLIYFAWTPVVRFLFSDKEEMVQKVQVYIYDLSRGMARSLGPAIIGNYN